MRIGLFLAYWPWFSPDEQLELASLADEQGLDSVWVSEAWGQDVVSVLGHLSATTERIALGSGLLQIPARTPAMTAMTAATLDTLSGGRFRLGLGVSGPQVSEGWHGVSFKRPVTRTREYVEIVRAALARAQPLSYEGEEFRLPLAGSELGKPLKMLIKPPRAEIPIYLGAVGPRAVEQTGEIADGWLPFMFSPARAEQMLAPVRAHGREIDVAPVVPVCVADDLGAARDLARPWLAIYLGGMGAKEKNFYVDLATEYGHGESASEVQDRFLAGDREGAGAALSDELIDESTICTTAPGLDERLAEYERAGADTLLALPFGDRPAIVAALVAAGRTWRRRRLRAEQRRNGIRASRLEPQAVDLQHELEVTGRVPVGPKVSVFPLLGAPEQRGRGVPDTPSVKHHPQRATIVDGFDAEAPNCEDSARRPATRPNPRLVCEP